MSTNIYSLCRPDSDKDRRTRSFRAGARADFALVADRSAPRIAPAPQFALQAETTVPAGASPPGYALAGEKRLVAANPWAKRAFYLALGVALLLHLAVLTPFMVQPAPSPDDDVRQLGMKDGAPENLSISVISEKDLKRWNSDPFRQEAAPTPTPAPDETPAPPPQQQTEPQPEKEAGKPQDAPTKEANAAETQKKDDKTRSFDVSGFIAMAADQFGSQLKAAVQSQERRQARASQQAGNVKSFRPGATHQGKSDEWERKVIWALAATKPMGNGKWGSAVVTFVVSQSGQVQGLRLIKSSGDNWLDQGALLAVKQARMPAPPPDLPTGDRQFNIEYISLPN